MDRPRRGCPLTYDTESAKKWPKLARQRQLPNTKVCLGKSFALWSETRKTTAAKNDVAFAKILLDRFENYYATVTARRHKHNLGLERYNYMFIQQFSPVATCHKTSFCCSINNCLQVKIKKKYFNN